MRLWPFRRHRPADPAAPDVVIADGLLRAGCDDVLAVRERWVGPGFVAFRGPLRVDAARALATLTERFRPFGCTPVLREDGDGVLVRAVPLAPEAPPSRIRWNVILFVLTCLTTLLAGVGSVGSPTFDAFRVSPLPLVWMLSGVPFAATLMGTLVVHEFGHYLTARRYGASVTLPYFIPAPPAIFMAGTLGAIIQMRSPARDRNSLFDIAAAGPLAGLAVALPAAVVGLAWSSVVPVPEGARLALGESALMRALVWLRFGDIPEGMMLFTHPVADAAWFGFLVTAINLFPAGQLDGGRIAYALFDRRHQAIGRATVAALVLVGLAVAGSRMLQGYDTLEAFLPALNWFVWAALIRFLVGYRHGLVLDTVTPFSARRRLLATLCLLLPVLMLPPVLVTFE